MSNLTITVNNRPCKFKSKGFCEQGQQKIYHFSVLGIYSTDGDIGKKNESENVLQVHGLWYMII